MASLCSALAQTGHPEAVIAAEKAAPSRALTTVTCPLTVTGQPDGYSTDPTPPATWTPEAGVDVPTGAIAYASPSPDGDVTYTISPPGYFCNAHDNETDSTGRYTPRRIAVYPPHQPTAVFNDGWNIQTSHPIPVSVLCGWFPALRQWPALGSAATSAQCSSPRATPAWEHAQFFPNRLGGEAEGLVVVDAGHREPFLATSGQSDAATVVLLSLSDAEESDGITGDGPSCAVTPAFASSCRANLEQHELASVSAAGGYARVTFGDVPATLAAIRAATDPPAASVSVSPTTGNVRLGVATVPATEVDGTATPNTLFQVTLLGACVDGSAPTWAVRSAASGRDLAAPVLTVVPDQSNSFFDGEVGSAHVEARCGEKTMKSLPIVISAETYVALGDSYASGEGAPEQQFRPGTTGNGKDSTGCHRAIATGWASIVSADSRMGAAPLSLVACSGAGVADLYQPNKQYLTSIGEYEPPQLYAIDPSATTRATLSIGGNDVDFSRIVTACVQVVPSVLHDQNCRNPRGPTFKLAEDGLNSLSRGVPVAGAVKTLSDVYTDVASRLAPGGILVVAGYPQLFSTRNNTYQRFVDNRIWPSCGLGTGGELKISRDDAHWFDSLARTGNTIIANAITQAQDRVDAEGRGVRIVPALYDRAFDNHRICDSDPWLNGVRLNLKRIESASVPVPYQTSMHPSVEGQQAIARVVEAAVYVAEHPLPSAVDQGASVTATVAGFAPDEQVTAELHSKPTRLGVFTADAGGMITAHVTIPADTPAGAHTLAFVGATSRVTESYPIRVQSDHPWYRYWPVAGALTVAVALVLLVIRRRARRRS